MNEELMFEPFRMKVVEPIHITDYSTRKNIIRNADYNVFRLKSEDVMIDLLTDSGTGAMSSDQWAALMRGDESYAGSPSFFRFEAAIRELIPFKHIIPTHQGRAAESILFGIVGNSNVVIPNNTHFDTTRGNIEITGAKAIDLVIQEGLDSSSDHQFKGNMDLESLDMIFTTYNDKTIPLVMLTITNNAGGGQPVSMENIRSVKEICKKYKRPLFIDGCRFAENAYFIKLREPGYENSSIKDIVKEMFSYADGMIMSAKKDGLSNSGGWLALNDDRLASIATERLILQEGFTTYGGMTGRDMEAIAIGLEEVIQEEYLSYRIQTSEYLGMKLDEIGIPVVKPIGGHAVFIDAKKFLKHINPLHYPGQSLAVALYEIGGIRGVEIGSVMFGLQPGGTEKPAKMELLRLAIPRRVYTKSHFDYVIKCFKDIKQEKDQLTGFKISWQPQTMRHFTAKFERI